MTREDIINKIDIALKKGDIASATIALANFVVENEVPERFKSQILPLMQANCFYHFHSNYLVLTADELYGTIDNHLLLILDKAVAQLVQEEAEANAPISQKNLLLNNIDRLID